jgi:hypothetical protein
MEPFARFSTYLNADFGENRSKFGHGGSQDENTGLSLSINVWDSLETETYDIDFHMMG